MNIDGKTKRKIRRGFFTIEEEWPRQPLVKSKTYVYFLLSGDRVKIGVTKDIESRIKALQSSNPEKLKLLYYTEGDRETEKMFHKGFSELRVQGEWFLYSGAVKDYIEQIKTARQVNES